MRPARPRTTARTHLEAWDVVVARAAQRTRGPRVHRGSVDTSTSRGRDGDPSTHLTRAALAALGRVCAEVARG